MNNFHSWIFQSPNPRIKQGIVFILDFIRSHNMDSILCYAIEYGLHVLCNWVWTPYYTMQLSTRTSYTILWDWVLELHTILCDWVWTSYYAMQLSMGFMYYAIEYGLHTILCDWVLELHILWRIWSSII